MAAAVPDAKLSVFADMVVFSNYAIQVILAFVLLNMVFVLLPRAQVSARRILEVISVTPSVQDGSGVQVRDKDRGKVEFRDVSFSYPESGEVISKISFCAEPGSTTAIIGATGSGKSTLVQLVPRLYDASSGQVLVDGCDVRDFELHDLHNRIGYVPQTATLFSGTVESNVAYGEAVESISEKNIERSLDIAQANEFVKKMPGGLNARIEQKGRNVSGGQRQRLTIARAIARNPEILVFDDSFSALDFSTDRALRQALQDSCPNTTCLIVAQRVGSIRHADQIIVLEHGSMVGKGTHDELMQTCDVYREIAYSQLSEEELKHD